MKLSARQNFVLKKKKKDLHRLAEALQIPGTLKCYQGTEIIPGKYLHATTTATTTTLFQYSHAELVHGITSASYPDVSLDMRAKEGGKETTGFACRLYPSHGPLRCITSHSFRARLCHAKNEAPEEEAAPPQWQKQTLLPRTLLVFVY